MAVIEESVAAATAVVGYDLLSAVPWAKQSGADRVLSEGGLAGSAAALDTKVAIMVGAARIGTLFNVAVGHVNSDRDMKDFGDALIPGGEPLSLLVEDAPATNPINIVLIIEELADELGF